MGRANVPLPHEAPPMGLSCTGYDADPQDLPFQGNLGLHSQIVLTKLFVLPQKPSQITGVPPNCLQVKVWPPFCAKRQAICHHR